MIDLELRTVSFEQAKKLKNLGFPQDSSTYISSIEKHSKTYAAPSLELVAKWFRQEKHISIIVEDYELCDEYNMYFSHLINLDIPYIYDMIKRTPKEYNARHFGRWESKIYDDYEDALNAGINEAIKRLSKKPKPKNFPCDTCPNNQEYLNGGECVCSKLERSY